MGIFKRLRENADRLNDYFVAAVKAYLFKGDEAAGLAAFSTGAVAATLQRTGMIAYLQRFSAELQNDSSIASDGPEEFRARGLIIAKLDALASQIAAKNWSMSDCVTAKKHLRKVDREYYEAQGRADPTVFYRRYPDLFSEYAQPPAKPASGPCCTTCGAKVDAGWAYCRACGAKQPMHSGYPQQPAQPPAQHVIAAGSNTCPDCGLINPRSSGKCDCGYVFDPEPCLQSPADIRSEGAKKSSRVTPAVQKCTGQQGDGDRLIQAAIERNRVAVEMLLDTGAETNTQDKHGMTALMYATLQGDTAISKLLLSKGCDPNLRNQDGATALITASTQGDVTIVRLLLEHRADPNVKMDDGTTALHWASQFGRQEIVQLLLAHGAKPTPL